LWLVVARRKGKEGWWYLTTEDCSTEQKATDVVRAYARRWQVGVGIGEHTSDQVGESDEDVGDRRIGLRFSDSLAGGGPQPHRPNTALVPSDRNTLAESDLSAPSSASRPGRHIERPRAHHHMERSSTHSRLPTVNSGCIMPYLAAAGKRGAKAPDMDGRVNIRVSRWFAYCL